MRFIRPLLVVACALVLPAAAHAQKLQTGRWTGRVTTPNGEITDITADVTMANDTAKMTIDAGAHGSFQIADVKFDGTTITFSFQPGPIVDCTLKKQEDGSFSGQCIEEGGGGAADMVLNPPKASDKK